MSAYAVASIFCLPSSAETQSHFAIEAMAAGTPVILGDFPYAYQPPFEKALRCNPADELSIENCIKKVFRSPERYSHSLPTDYTWKNIAIKIKKIYDEVASFKSLGVLFPAASGRGSSLRPMLAKSPACCNLDPTSDQVDWRRKMSAGSRAPYCDDS